MQRNAEIYVHIPFCAKKCEYCDFLSGPASEDSKKVYMEALRKEISLLAGRWGEKYRIDSIFFGGGTPSHVEAKELALCLRQIQSCFLVDENAEISLEANPGTLTEEKLAVYREAGFNRLSLGLQSADNGMLKSLGRIHTYEEFLESFRLARKAGFDNTNVDLMFSLPGQTMEIWQETLRSVLELKPEHISAYSLILEENTPFYEKYASRPEMLPDEDTDRAMFQKTEEILRREGLFRYEISNYAREGFACRHNIGYWRGKEYLGAGLGAAGLTGEPGGKRERYSNERDMEEYIKILSEGRLPASEREALTREAQMEEFMFLGLRCMEGVDIRQFEEQFQVSFQKIYGEVTEKLAKAGLVEYCGKAGLRLTGRGIDVSNRVFEEYLLS